MFSQNTYILVVDDASTIRKIIVDSLKKLGFTNIDQAADANEAQGKVMFAASQSRPYDLILSDLNMPGPNGIDFLKQIRANDTYKNAPFILITTESEKGAVIEAATNGVSAYVVKPFNIETLKKRLIEAWRKHHPEAALPS